MFGICKDIGIRFLVPTSDLFSCFYGSISIILDAANLSNAARGYDC